MTQPLVSITCSTYNHEKFIRRAIEGFLAQQTDFPVEILIHDDASTDDTPRIIREFADTHPGLITPVLQTENQYSRGKRPLVDFVFPRARGRYIAVCEGDDFWTDPHKLQKQVDLLEAHEEYVICFHDAMIVNADDEVVSKTYHNKRPLEDATEFSVEDFITSVSNFIPTASIVFRTRAFNPGQWNTGIRLGDIYLIVSLCSHPPHNRIRFLNETMSAYRIHEGGMYMGKTEREKYLTSIFARIRISRCFPQFQNSFDTWIERCLASLIESKIHLSESNLTLARELDQLKQTSREKPRTKGPAEKPRAGNTALSYKSYEDLSLTIHRNLSRIPRDIDLVVGIPRSGMLPATMLGLMLNKPVVALDSFLKGTLYEIGKYRRPMAYVTDFHKIKKALILDDSINSGQSMHQVREKIRDCGRALPETLFAAVYYVRESLDKVDIGLEECPWPRIFQWNILNSWILSDACVDIDGVVCVDPTEEENDDGVRYRAFLKTARPLYTTEFPIGCFVTSRLEKYRDLTEEWLKDNHFTYSDLVMLDLPSKEERLKRNAHASFKAEVYRNRKESLFIESNLSQAVEIARLTGKPVFCTETMEMIDPSRQDISHDSTLTCSQGVERILLVNHNLYPLELSGTPLSTRNHACGLVRKGLDVAVLIPDPQVKKGYRKEQSADGFMVYHVPAMDRYSAYLCAPGRHDLPEFRQTIEHIIDDFCPQVVQVNDYVYMPAEIVDIFSRRGCIVVREVCNCEELCHWNYPVIASGMNGRLCTGPESPGKCASCYAALPGVMKDPDDKLLRSLEQAVGERFEQVQKLYRDAVDMTVFTSEPFRAFFTRFVPLPEDKTRVIPRGFDFPFPRAAAREMRPGSVVHFAFIGNVMFSKGIDVALNAFERISSEPGFVFHVYGQIVDTEYRDWLDRLQSLHPDRFVYHGPFTEDGLCTIASSIDVCIVPSYFDTYNRVVREFLYLGTPVIATDFFGAYIVEDGINGFRVPAGDAEALAGRMLDLIRTPSLLEDLARGASQTLIPGLDEEIDALMETYLGLYAGLPEARKARLAEMTASCGNRPAPPDGKRRAETCTRRAEAALAQGRTGDAEHLLQEALSHDPESARALHQLGLLRHRQGDLGNAILFLEKALALAPGDAELTNDLGTLCYLNGDHDRAVTLFHRAVKLDRTLLDARRNLADLLAAQGRYREAERLYAGILRQNPGDTDAHEALERIRGFAKAAPPSPGHSAGTASGPSDGLVRDILRNTRACTDALTTPAMDLPQGGRHAMPGTQGASEAPAKRRIVATLETMERTMMDIPREDKPAPADRAVRFLAFYLPQFHPIPENNRWWGEGFTEWTNVAKARPLFDGHYQPHLPADLGFYDLRLPEVRQAQADLARRYGISGFCYYHYWFNGKRLLNRVFDEVLESGKPDFPFCICWANENWTRVWDGGDRKVLMQQQYSEEDDLAHITWLIRAFNDPRYIRIQEKPLLLIYRATDLPDSARTAGIWREEVRKAGFPGLYLCRVESFAGEQTPPMEAGFDAAVEFQPDWSRLGQEDGTYPDLHVFDYGAVAERMIQKPQPGYLRFPCVTPSWDNTPRRGRDGCILHGSTPDLYGRWLKEAVYKVRSHAPEEKIVFINAWNEWAEGNHLEPDQAHGHGYLRATQRALAMDSEPAYLNEKLTDRAASAMEKGRLADAEKLFQAALSHDPAAPRTLQLYAALLFQQGKPDDAKNRLTQAIEKDPSNAELYNDLGAVCHASGDTAGAISHLEEALRIDPDCAPALKNLTEILLENNQVEKARRMCARLLSSHPGDTEARALWADITSAPGVDQGADTANSIQRNRAQWSNYEWTEGGDEWSACWGGTEQLWQRTIQPRIASFLPAGHILEIAPGFGWCTQYLVPQCTELTLVDLTEKCIEACRKRFQAHPHIRYFVNDGRSLDMLEDGSIDFAFSWDSLVHVEKDVMRSYLHELAAKLRPGGAGFLHHSNIGAFLDPATGKLTVENRHWRGENMSAQLFRDYCQEAGLKCVSQEILAWGGTVLNDCISVFVREPGYDPDKTVVVENPDFMEESRGRKVPPDIYGQMRSRRDEAAGPGKPGEPSGEDARHGGNAPCLLSIILSVKAGTDRAVQGIKSLLRGMPRNAVELIVVACNSFDPADDRLARLSHESLTVVTPSGPASQVQGCGLAVQKASGRFLALADDSVLFSKAWLPGIMKTIDEGSGWDAVVGRTITAGGLIVEAGSSTPGTAGLEGRGSGNPLHDPAYSFSCPVGSGSRYCMLVSRQAWKDMNGLDAGLEDLGPALVDLGLRMVSQGFRVLYQPQCILVANDAVSPGPKATTALSPEPGVLASLRPKELAPGVLKALSGSGRRSVLVLGIYLANTLNTVTDLVSVFKNSRSHSVVQKWVALNGSPPDEQTAGVTVRELTGRFPKFRIVNDLLAGEDLSGYDYVILCDDDVVLPEGFVDSFIALQDNLGFAVAQPARTLNSYIDHPIVEQHIGVHARQTLFVEIGPVVSFHRSAFGFVFPFDLTSPMGWGYENVWAREVLQRGLNMGIIDAVCVDHSLRKPVAHYDWEQADAQRNAYLESHDHLSLDECFTVLGAHLIAEEPA